MCGATAGAEKSKERACFLFIFVVVCFRGDLNLQPVLDTVRFP